MIDTQTRFDKPLSLQTTADSDEETIDLTELFYAIAAKWKPIVAATLVCALAAALWVFFLATPKYEATATIYVVGQSDSSLSVTDLNLGTALVSDCVKVFKMWEVHEQVIENLNLPYTYTEMEEMLEVENTSDTRMIDITFTSLSAQEAAEVANEYAEVASEYIEETMKTDRPTKISTALVPANPVSPKKAKTILLAALVGCVAAAAVVVVVFLMDDTYKTADDIKKYTGLVTLAAIPVQKSSGNHRKRMVKSESKISGGAK